MAGGRFLSAFFRGAAPGPAPFFTKKGGKKLAYCRSRNAAPAYAYTSEFALTNAISSSTWVKASPVTVSAAP